MTVPLDLVLPILVNCYLNLHIHMHTVDTGTPSISISITVIIIFTCVTTSRTCIFWGTLKGTASPTPPLNGNAKSGGGVCPHHRSLHQIRDHKGSFSPIPETLGESTPPSPTAGAVAQKRKVEQTPETDSSQQRARRRARQSREYALI